MKYVDRGYVTHRQRYIYIGRDGRAGRQTEVKSNLYETNI